MVASSVIETLQLTVDVSVNSPWRDRTADSAAGSDKGCGGTGEIIRERGRNAPCLFTGEAEMATKKKI